MSDEGMAIEHRLVRNGADSLDTCTACDWASWDTAPTFAEHQHTTTDQRATGREREQG